MTAKSKENILAVDIGGSHITASIVYSSDKQLLPESTERRSIDSHASANEIIEAWLEVLTEVKNKTTISCSAMAVSMPGPFNYNEGISLIKGMNKYEALYGLNLKHIFAEGLGLPLDRIVFINDAEAFLRGEISCCQINKQQSVIGVSIGTGLGSARYSENLVTDLNLGSAAFRDGITEDYISTRGLIGYYKSIGGIDALDVFTLTQLTETDEKARETLKQLGVWIAEFLKTHLTTMGAKYVILGGNISRAHAHFLPAARDLLDDSTIKIYIAELGEQAPMIGAAAYATDFFTDNLFEPFY